MQGISLYVETVSFLHAYQLPSMNILGNDFLFVILMLPR